MDTPPLGLPGDWSLRAEYIYPPENVNSMGAKAQSSVPELFMNEILVTREAHTHPLVPRPHPSPNRLLLVIVTRFSHQF